MEKKVKMACRLYRVAQITSIQKNKKHTHHSMWWQNTKRVCVCVESNFDFFFILFCEQNSELAAA